MKIRRIALFGGAFDPVHNGHIEAARFVCRTRHLDKLIFIPSGVPPHRSLPYATGQDRLAMLERAVPRSSRYIVSDYEIRAGARTNAAVYTIQTMSYFRRRYSESAEFFIVIGADEAIILHTWKRVSALCRYATFLVCRRYEAGDMRIPPDIAGCCRIMNNPLWRYSSQDIRLRIARGLSVKGYIPERVASYIREHKLYRIT